MGCDATAKALGFFDLALSLDPDSADFLYGSARADAVSASILGAAIACAYASAEANLTKALSRVPITRARTCGWGSSDFHQARCAGRCRMRAYVGARSKSCSGPFPYRDGQDFIGRPEETAAHIREAVRLSPRDPHAYLLWLHWDGLAKICLGLWDQAIESSGGRSRPTEIFGRRISYWPRRLLGSLDGARPAPT